jgi:hypothetical protein
MTPDRMGQGLRHWNRASDLAVMLDMIAGANETMVGAIFADLILSAPPDAWPIVLQLCADADSLRAAARTAH